MENFALTVASTTVEKGSLGLFFLGQAGFLFKTSEGKLLAVDPYLSDCCNRYFGFKRLMPRLLSADELSLDCLVATHAHYDHFDPDSVPSLLAGGRTAFFGALDTKDECERLGLKDNLHFLAVGDTVTEAGFTLTALPCDHGEGTPYAIGILIEAEGKRIAILGDTCYRADNFANKALQNLDVLILPINGAFGNLNEAEAAKAASVIRPRLTIPCHYWNFAEHGGNPNLFMQAMKETVPELPFLLMRQGEARKV